MTISAGTYTIGTGMDYTNLTAFRTAIAAALTGDLTGVISTDITETAENSFAANILAGHTLCIDNAVTRISHLDARNKLTLDSTTADFNALYFYQNSASGDGTFILRNQYIQRIHSKNNSVADVRIFPQVYGFNCFIHNNIFDDVGSVDNTACYHIYTAYAAAAQSYIYNNIFRGGNYQLLLQNTTDNYVCVENNIVDGAGTGYRGIAAATAGNNVQINNNIVFNHTDRDFRTINTTGVPGVSNMCSEALNAYNVLTGGTNYYSQTILNHFESTTFTDPCYMSPKAISTALHNGTAFLSSGHTAYFNNLPRLVNDVTIGAKSKRMQDMFTTT